MAAYSILLRNLGPGSFTRIAIEESFGLSKLMGTVVPITAFSRYERGYHFADLLSARGAHIRFVGFEGLWARLSSKLLSLFVPRSRDSASALPLLEMFRWAILGRDTYTVLYCEDQFVALAGLVRRLLRGTPYVVFVAEQISRKGTGSTLRFGRSRVLAYFVDRVLRSFERTILESASSTLFCSQQSMDYTLGTFPFLAKRNPDILYPGCHPSSTGSLSCEKTSKHFLSVSKWDAGRHPEFLLSLARLVPAHFVVAGSWISKDAELNYRNLLTTLGPALRGVVELKTDLQESDLEHLYSEAIAYLHWNPEGFGMGVLEAMAHGVPVICTKEAGASELVRESRSGFIVSESSPTEFARVANILLKDTALRAHLGRGGLAIAADYTWEKHNARLVEELHRVGLPDRKSKSRVT